TADPNYRIGETVFNGIRCIALVQEPHAAGWHNASKYIAQVIDVNSQNIGPYHYPKMICADAQDGMEYPMITLDGGWDPNYRSLFVHEMTHNWFFGMIGSNENYRAFLDEGFTQFYTADTYQFIEGPFEKEGPKPNKSLMDKYVNEFTKPSKVIDRHFYNSYYITNVMRDEKVTLNTHSDDFNGAIRHGGGYGQVYYKTATMLKNLEYVLGRALYDKAIQFYFYQWKYCHPYPEDFRNSITQFTGLDLNWFFDQWLETTKTIDYKIGRIKKKGKGNYEITFKRKGEMQMPIDFAVVDGNDSAIHYYIPNTWFEKPTRANTLPRWIGWGPKIKPTYVAKINVPNGIKNVIIDPSKRLADIDMTNNVKKGKINVRFDSKVYNPPNWKQYDMRLRPSLWYNGYDGLKIGAALSGDYLNTKHVFDITGWFSTGLFQNQIDSTDFISRFNSVSFILNYKTSLNKFLPRTNFFAQGKVLDGLDGATFGLERFNHSFSTRIYSYYKGMLRDLPQDMTYLIHSNEWGYRKWNSAIHVGLDHSYRYLKGNGKINFNIRTAAFTNDYDYSAMTLSAVNKNDLGKININTRVFGQFGFGLLIPDESALFVAGANNEELMDNKYTRSFGFISRDWGNYGKVTNHFTAGGGLNLRGYSGYLLAEQNPDGTLSFNYKGITGAAFNMEIEFGELFKFLKPKKFRNAFIFTPYLFADAGIINTNAPGKTVVMSSPMADAGAGISLNINRWGKLSYLEPLVIRFDVPAFITRLPNEENDYVQFRWMIGINRAF
ncbi:MAG: M1 family aminopeptidase, partial [Bacteroidia bacterium]